MAPRKASAEHAAKKVAEAEAPVAKKPAAKKPAAKKPAAKKAVEVIVQSPLGGEISFAEILAKIGEADKVYRSCRSEQGVLGTRRRDRRR